MAAKTRAKTRQQKPPETPGIGVDGTPKEPTRHIHAREPANYGVFAQIIRSIFIIIFVGLCCLAICVSQLVGAPLYFVNREYFDAYMAKTKRSFGITLTALTEWSSPTPVRISGDKSVLGQFGLAEDGRLLTQFPDRLVLISNHQVYTDWIYLWWVTYTNQMHGHIYIILKESLKYIPMVGQGMMFYGFIFMARKWMSDKPRLQHRLEKLKRVREESPSGSPKYNPMWLLIFPEGTNLSTNTREINGAYAKKRGLHPLKHQIIPRSTGLFFCLQQLRGTVDWVYDCTVGYEGPPKGSFPDKYFSIRSTYLQCRPPRVVNFYWRRFAVSDIPLNDQQEFESWLLNQWEVKDALLDQFIETGKFPPFEDGDTTSDSYKVASGDSPGYIETDIRLGHWIEIVKIFTVPIILAVAIKLIQGS